MKNFPSAVWIPWSLSRLLIVALLIFASQLGLANVAPPEMRNYNPIFPTLTWDCASIFTSLGRIFHSADANYYLEIADHGYERTGFTETAPKNWTFFPLFPIAISMVGKIVGSNFWAGLLIANVSFLAGLFFLHRHLNEQFGESVATRTIWLLCFFPTSYFFSGIFTESLFLLLIVCAFFKYDPARPYLSALAMGLAAVCRPTGVLLLPAYGALVLTREPKRSLRVVLTLAVSTVFLAIFCAHQFSVTGNPLAWLLNQNAHGRGEHSLLAPFRLLLEGTLLRSWDFVLLNLLFFCLSVVAAVYYFRQKDFVWALIALLPPLAALSTGSSISMTRFVMVLFPVTVFLATLSERPIFERIMTIFFATGLAVMTLMFGAHLTAGMA